MKTRTHPTPASVRTRTGKSILFTRTTALVVLSIVVAAAFYSASSASPPRALRANTSAGSSPRKTITGLKADVSAASVLGVRPRGTAPLRPMFSGEAVETFAADCETGSTQFNLGDTVCVKATGVGGGLHRLTWVDPANIGVRSIDITSDPQTDTFTLPSTTSSIVGGQTVDNRGSWRVIVTSIVFATTEATAPFIVNDPTQPTVDLAIYSSGSYDVSPGGNVTFTLLVTNYGPDTAQNVQITDSVPANTTFVAETQDSGPAFSCTNPSAGGTGTTTCTIASLLKDDTATFTLVYSVSSQASSGTTISNVATVSSSTSEIHTWDNTWQTNTIVRTTPPGQCTISCPQNISLDNDPSAANPCVATATYTTPATSGDCSNPETGQTPPVVCSPPSNSAFPVGTTTVTCSSGGTACTFIVTVHETRAGADPTINCPTNVSANEEFPGAGAANVNYPSPTATGNCVTVVCDPPSGFRFLVGVTTVTCTATTDDTPSRPTATCSFTVTVNSGNCSITCPGDITQASPQCSPVVVTYPDPTASGSCGTATCSPASGSTFAVGTTVVTCSISGGPSCDFTVTVTAPAAPTITTCAANKNISVNSVCDAAIPNLVSEVVATGCGVTVSQSPAAGSIVGPGTYAVIITAENSAGQATCTATVTVADTTPPSVTCPAGTTVTAGPSCAVVPNVIGGVTASDNCTPPELLTITQSPVAGTTVGSGTTTITVTVRDEAGNTRTCTTTFTVVDTTPPTITCPANITRPNDPGQCSAVVTYPNATATDNCSGVGTPVCTPASGSTFQKGTTTVTCTVSDASGNSSSCSFTVTVNDTQLPAISCPANITVEPTCPSGAVVNYTAPVGTDNCPGATTTRTGGPASGSIFPIGTTTITFTVTDTSGNMATCSFTVHVKTPAEVIQDLINRVQALINQGVLNQANGQGLINKLQQALDYVNSGQTAAACDRLDSFIDKVTDYIQHGTLTSAQGQSLIDSARHAKNGLGCSAVSCT